MALNVLALATTLENLGARRLLAKKVNFVPCNDKTPLSLIQLRGIHNNNQKVIGLNPLSDQVITNKSSLISPLLEEQPPCG